MTVNPMCEHVETAQGVALTVTGVAQIKIMSAEDLLRTAAEQFLGVHRQQLMSTVNQTLEGHLRAILGKFRFVELAVLNTFYIGRYFQAT
jgi:flotillin